MWILFLNHSLSTYLCKYFSSKYTKLIHITLLIALYRNEIWSLTLRDEHGQRGFWNEVVKTIFGPKRDDVKENWEISIKRSFTIWTPHVSVVKSNRMIWLEHVADTGEIKKLVQNFGWWTDHFVDLRSDRRIILKWNSQK